MGKGSVVPSPEGDARRWFVVVLRATESFEVFSPDGSMMELTGGQENINKFKDLVAENV